jgi:alpha/beta hydrolase fold
VRVDLQIALSLREQENEGAKHNRLGQGVCFFATHFSRHRTCCGCWKSCFGAISAHSAIVGIDNSKLPPYGNATLPPGIRSRIVDNVNGLAMHVLEAGFEPKGRPCVLLLHGFPELAYSWRKLMLFLAEAGFYVVAPDQRGYGRTGGWDDAYDGDVDSFRRFNLVRDALGLVSALGYRSVAAVVGHDHGAPNAAYCALLRPDVFCSVVLLSVPFGGPPELPF